MSFWFLRGLRRGVVTTRYPNGLDVSAALLPTPPAFRVGLLTVEVAERLIASCPTGALARDGAVLRYDIGACTACGRCRDSAPAVVADSGVFELATTSRRRLVRLFPLTDGEGGDR